MTVPANSGSGPAAAAQSSAVAEYATLIIAAFLIVLDALAQAGIVGHPSDLLNAFAAIGLGAVFGVVPQLGNKAQVSANTAAVIAAHQRLDAAGAPPAADVPAGTYPPTHDGH